MNAEDAKPHPLMDVYRRLLSAYGPQDWWPGDSPFEIIVGAILTQATSWTNVEKAIINLKDKLDILCSGRLAGHLRRRTRPTDPSFRLLQR